MMAGASAFFQPQKLYVFFHCPSLSPSILHYSTVFSSTPIFPILHLTTPPPLRYSSYHISVKALVETKSHPDINIHSHSTANHIYTKMAYIYSYDIVTCVIYYSSTAAFRTPHPSQAHTTHLTSPRQEPRLQDG